MPEQQQLLVKPLGNDAAYALFLRARERETHQTELDLAAARDLYADAIAADPSVAEAHACYARLLATFGDAAKAKLEATEALRLNPDLGEAHFALSRIYEVERDYAAAVPEIEMAERASPTDSDIIYAAASLHRRQGKWQQSLAEFQKAVTLNPRNFDGPTNLAYHLSLMRDWPAAIAAWDRALAIVPEYMFNKIARAYVDFWSRGELRRGKALLASYPPEYAGQFKEFLAWMRWDFNLLERDYPAAEQAVANINQDPVDGGFLGPITRSYMRGCIALAQGNREAATPLFAESCKFFEERVRKTPNRAQPHMRLAMTYAFMGQKEDALREEAKATELCPESKDTFDGAVVSTARPVVYAWTGESDKAIAELARLLRTPGALNYDCSITLNDLKYRWLWDPLRTDPRFQQIVAGAEPQTIVP
ncbi:MAG: hypothetical protein ABR526_07275 [Chthoniobacterales bacterium]